MGLFDKLFSSGSDKKVSSHRPQVFGRYSDNNKTAFQQEEWKKSKQLYEEKKYSESLVHFFTYLRDAEIENVVFEPDNENARFHIYQGSKKITGTIDNDCLKAEVPIARFTKRSVPVMRKLLEKNFELYYSKFYLEGDKFKLKIYNNIGAAAPGKLYFALKELCIQADRLDDILVDDFDALEPTGIDHIIDCPDDVKQTKYDFFRYWIDKTIEKIEALNPDTFAGGITYMMLNLVYKLDYLLLPEGKLTEKLEEVNNIFWSLVKETPAAIRNQRMLESLKELQQWTEEDIKKYCYRTKHTFALSKPTDYVNVVETIENTFNNVVWYRENGHDDIAIEMLEYSLGYSQFSFSLPKPATQLFDILMQVNHNDYYNAMGLTDRLYDRSNKEFNDKKIIELVETINKENKERYELLNIDSTALNFENLINFNISLLVEVSKLDFGKKQ